MQTNSVDFNKLENIKQNNYVTFISFLGFIKNIEHMTLYDKDDFK